MSTLARAGPRGSYLDTAVDTTLKLISAVMG